MAQQYSPYNMPMSFAGMRVLGLESRRAAELAQLIRNRQGEPLVAPSMREVPLQHNEPAFQFAERLFAGEFDMMIFLTGVGTRALNQVLASRYSPERFPDALRNLTTVARGPKPVAVLREMNVPVTITVPEPNTWREILQVTEGRPEGRIAVQEYGRPNAELLDGLRARGAEVMAVRVYQWDLPEDRRPLQEAAQQLANRQIDVALFTTSVQIEHLLRVAAEMALDNQVKAALNNHTIVASIGPTTSEALAEFGIHVDFEPSHPKMGFLAQETADRAPALLEKKRPGAIKQHEKTVHGPDR